MLFKRVATARNVVPPSFQTPADREKSLHALPHAYSLKTSSIPKYFQAILTLPVPEVFAPDFLVSIGFRYAIDLSFIDILKELRFISAQGTPTPRYFAFHDGGAPHAVLQDGIRDAYGRLLESDPDACAKRDEQVFETFKALYAGQESDMTVLGIAKTFAALCSFTRELERNPPQRPANEVAATAFAAAETTGPETTAASHAPGVAAPAGHDAHATSDAVAEIAHAPAAAALPPEDAAMDASRTPDAVATAPGLPALAPEAPTQACTAGIRPVRPDAAEAEGQAPAAPGSVQSILPHSDAPTVYDRIFASFKRHLPHFLK